MLRRRSANPAERRRFGFPVEGKPRMLHGGRSTRREAAHNCHIARPKKVVLRADKSGRTK